MLFKKTSNRSQLYISTKYGINGFFFSNLSKNQMARGVHKLLTSWDEKDIREMSARVIAGHFSIIEKEFFSFCNKEVGCEEALLDPSVVENDNGVLVIDLTSNVLKIGFFMHSNTSDLWKYEPYKSYSFSEYAFLCAKEEHESLELLQSMSHDLKDFPVVNSSLQYQLFPQMVDKELIFWEHIEKFLAEPVAA